MAWKKLVAANREVVQAAVTAVEIAVAVQAAGISHEKTSLFHIRPAVCVGVGKLP
jgi:hypothetical protein